MVIDEQLSGMRAAASVPPARTQAALLIGRLSLAPVALAFFQLLRQSQQLALPLRLARPRRNETQVGRSQFPNLGFGHGTPWRGRSIKVHLGIFTKKKPETRCRVEIKAGE